jgi:signal transduction histidine kinase
VASQRKERLAFLTSVVDDLKTPDPSRISRALDDLGDLVAIERSGLRLEDRIVDLTELLERVVEMAGGKASTHPVIFSAPAVRTWALADPSKLERAVFALLTKLRKISPPGTPLAISLGRAAKGEGAFRDAEIHVGERGAEHPSAGPAPREEGALHHWVHENGFGVALAHRIVEAHGGKLRVSGAPGSAFQFVVRIPEERIASGASLTAAAPASAPAFALGSWLEGGRLNPVLAKQAVNLRS